MNKYHSHIPHITISNNNDEYKWFSKYNMKYPEYLRQGDCENVSINKHLNKNNQVNKLNRIYICMYTS